MTMNRLSIVNPVHAENHRLMQARHDRCTRIDALSVDRSRLAALPLQRWSAEALEAGEEQRSLDRRDLTLVEKMRAWKVLLPSLFLR